MSNLQKHIWEGWTVIDFINELKPLFDRLRKFESDQELKQWCKDNQPYYKKHIPEVYAYFRKLNSQKSQYHEFI